LGAFEQPYNVMPLRTSAASKNRRIRMIFPDSYF
jgi:hypothetical protein